MVLRLEAFESTTVMTKDGNINLFTYCYLFALFIMLNIFQRTDEKPCKKKCILDIDHADN